MTLVARRPLGEMLNAFVLADWLDWQGVDYKRSHGHSGEQIGIHECPFCGNDKWKVYANAETGAGNCFRCDTKFSKWSFISQVLGNPASGRVRDHIASFLDAIGWRPTPRKAAVTPVDESEAIQLPTSFELPTEDGRNLQYLEDRGIDGDLCRQFELRFCAYGEWRYRNLAGEDKIARFDDRVIIPVRDLDGKLVTFQGRDVTGTSDRKYLFPATLPGTGRFLYNGHKAIGAKHVVLNEGAFDVIAVARALSLYREHDGLVPIGSFGKHLSGSKIGENDQLARFIILKRKGLEIVTIMWDGEVDALNAAAKAAELLASIGLKVKIALLPKDCDPNEVEPHVIWEALRKAVSYSKSQALRWKLSNPYR